MLLICKLWPVEGIFTSSVDHHGQQHIDPNVSWMTFFKSINAIIKQLVLTYYRYIAVFLRDFLNYQSISNWAIALTTHEAARTFSVKHLYTISELFHLLSSPPCMQMPQIASLFRDMANFRSQETRCQMRWFTQHIIRCFQACSSPRSTTFCITGQKCMTSCALQIFCSQLKTYAQVIEKSLSFIYTV